MNFNHEWGYDVIELYDNSFICVGARDRYNEGSKNMLISRISKNGKLIWEKEILKMGKKVKQHTAYQ